jgi:signal transduction histidine kinase
VKCSKSEVTSAGACEHAPVERAEALLTGQNHALELIAGNAPLGEVLDYAMRLIESQAPDVVCSVLLLEDGHLRHGAAPSMPEALIRAIDGVAIGPAVGSCGTSAFTGQPAVVVDITTDPRWAPYPEVVALAVAAGLRACWSTPILSASGEVLGTFAIYYREPGPPRARDLYLVEIATHLAGIAIERHRSDQALAQRAEQLAEADRRKDEFLALLAHELRNPLAPIVTALELLRTRKDDPATVERYRAMMERQVRQLGRLVDDLLDVSRITRGKIALVKERVTAADLAARAVEAARPLLQQRGHELRVDLPGEPLEVEVDPMRLAQALSNLLNNAAKYTPRGGHVALQARREGDEVVFSVRDAGIGIEPEMLGRVFDLFVQADTAIARSQGGLGIGLTLVKRLVELHGGTVEAHSAGRGAGSELILRLPAAPPLVHATARSDPDPAAGQQTSAGRRIVIADDNVDAAECLAEALRAAGNEVRVAHDGLSALAAVASLRPHVAFIDIGLPELDGYEVARRVRAEHPADGPRLVALTGFGRESDLARARAAGFDAHVVKPANLDLITSLLES